MTSNQALIKTMKKIFKKNGGAALKNARNEILLTYKGDSVISQALQHFSKVTLHNALPVFPALISISCRAVGGTIEDATPFGEAIVLITGAADLHDDVIDQSFSKGPKPTVLGKFGVSASVLAGDILLVQGLNQLHSKCDLLPKKQGDMIRSLVAEAVIEICTAETLETKLKGRLDFSPNEYYEIIRLKAVVPELTMKIGAILGNGDSNVNEKLGQFGRSYGIISIISDEFADILDSAELKNRLKNECPPLPLIYALQNPKTKAALLPLLSEDFSNNCVHEKIVEMIFLTPEVQLFQKNLVSSATREFENLSKILKEEIREELKILLLAPLSYLGEELSS